MSLTQFDIDHWQRLQRNSTSRLNAYFEEWAVLTEGAENQRLNVSDDTVWAWEMMWPRIAGWYGVEWEGPREEAKYQEVETRYKPGPRG